MSSPYVYHQIEMITKVKTYQNDLASYPLFGTVRAMKEVDYKLVLEANQSPFFVFDKVKECTFFNQVGNKLEQNHHKQDHEKTIYEYNSRGQLKTIKNFQTARGGLHDKAGFDIQYGKLKTIEDPESNGLLQYCTLFYYDDAGQLRCSEYYNNTFPRGLELEDRTLYNQKKQEVEYLIYLKGVVYSKQISYYNEAGLLTQITTTQADGRERNSYFQYDALGRQIEVIAEPFTKQEEGRKQRYEYANEDNMIFLYESSLDEKTMYFEQGCQFDGNDNQLLSEINYPGMAYRNWWEYNRFDAKNNLLTRQTNSTNFRWKYTFDEQGNWIERLNIVNNQIIGKTIRSFLYFDK